MSRKNTVPSHFELPGFGTGTPDRSGEKPKKHRGRALSRVALGAFLAYAGTAHLSFRRQEFQSQVPDWVPLDKDLVVLASGVVEILLGAGLVSGVRKKFHGQAAVAFFIGVFPGNVAQFAERRDAFGLDTDAKRALRLLGQPVLVAWALNSTRED